MKKGTLRNCMKRAQRRIRKRLRKALAHAKSKLPEKLVRKLEKVYEEISEYFVFHPWLSHFMESRFVWGFRNVTFDLRNAISNCRYDFGRWIHRAAEHSKSRFDWKVIEPIRRLLFTIHTETRNKKYKKGVSEKGLPDGFHYRIEGLRVRGGALLMMEGYCHKAEHGAYVHIESETGTKFIFDIDMLDPIAGDRHAIPDDDYVQIFLWIHRHEQELSFEWYAYASPIVEWHRWNVIDRYRTYLERRQMQARLRAELLMPSSKYRRR